MPQVARGIGISCHVASLWYSATACGTITKDERGAHFQVLYNTEVSLVTIRHYNEDIIKRLTNSKNVLVEQKTRQTARFVCAS